MSIVDPVLGDSSSLAFADQRDLHAVEVWHFTLIVRCNQHPHTWTGGIMANSISKCLQHRHQLITSNQSRMHQQDWLSADSSTLLRCPVRLRSSSAKISPIVCVVALCIRFIDVVPREFVLFRLHPQLLDQKFIKRDTLKVGEPVQEIAFSRSQVTWLHCQDQETAVSIRMLQSIFCLPSFNRFWRR